METIQVVLEADLLQAADRAARRSKMNRSALIRQALREHLARLRIQALEQRDRRGYATSSGQEDLDPWDGALAWPET